MPYLLPNVPVLSRKGKTAKETAEFFRDARSLLSQASLLNPSIARNDAEMLYFRLKDYQNDHKRIGWDSVRIVKNQNLYLIEEGLRIYLWCTNSPRDGYRLAVCSVLRTL